MLNLLKKTTPWMVASLFVATSLFGQGQEASPKPCPPKCEPKCAPQPKCPPKPCPKPCPQPCPPTQVCPADQTPCCPSWSTPVLNAAYNYPARTRTRCPWDFDAFASFIYWQPIQENMELGLSNTTATPGTDLHASVINMDFNYKPGFKVGMGGYFDYDNWDLQLQYTWFHNTQKQSFDAEEVGQVIQSRGTAFLDGSAVTQYRSASQNWKLDMDIVDLDLGRWYYVGTKLTFRPSFGARAAWIGQKTETDYDNAVTDDFYDINKKSRSWALGAKAALDTNWMLGSGFRLYGNGEADLLFTKYTRASYSASHSTAAGVVTDPVSVTQRRIYAVKPHLDLELGFGWGTYVDCNNWYLDFSAGYGFQVFFDQNMFRSFNDDVSQGISTMPNGNLYIHGLTATFKLDF